MLVVGPAGWASQVPGSICGYVLGGNGPREGLSIQGNTVIAYGPAGGGSCETDDDGWYCIGGLPPGTYTVEPQNDCLANSIPATQQVAVSSATASRADFAIWAQFPDPILTIGGKGRAEDPNQVIGNLHELGVTIDVEICDMWFNNLHIWAEREGGNHTVELFDGVPDLGPADIVELYQDGHGQWRAIYELVLRWDTTVCYNDTYYVMGTVNCENLTSIGAVEVEHSVPPHPVYDIRNCLIKEVETNAGNPDYLFYDPHHEDYAEPTVDFTIEDEGPVSGPYEWTVFFRPTGYLSWAQGGYGWVQGTAAGPGEVNAVLAQGVAGQTQSANWLGDPGIYGIEIQIEEMGLDDFAEPCVIDEQWLKWPYLLRLEICDVYMRSSHGIGDPELWLQYRINDTIDANEVVAEVFDAELQLLTSVSLETVRGVVQDKRLMYLPQRSLPRGPVYVVVRGVDAHGNDPVPRHYREEQNHRALVSTATCKPLRVYSLHGPVEENDLPSLLFPYLAGDTLDSFDGFSDYMCDGPTVLSMSSISLACRDGDVVSFHGHGRPNEMCGTEDVSSQELASLGDLSHLKLLIAFSCNSGLSSGGHSLLDLHSTAGVQCVVGFDELLNDLAPDFLDTFWEKALDDEWMVTEALNYASIWCLWQELQDDPPSFGLASWHNAGDAQLMPIYQP